MLLFAQDTAFHGFLPTRGSIMLDFVFAAMFGIIAIMGVSIYLVRYRKKYDLHKWIQIGLGVTLLLAVAAFEIDLQLFTNWRELAKASPHYSTLVDYSLWIHLCFAIPTPLMWIYVIVQGVRKFPSPVTPCEYSATHILTARIAAIGMLMTAVTGWIFYWLAFIAS